MDIQIKSALLGGVIPTVGAFAIFFLGDFSTQSKLERDTVQVLSEKFDSVEKDMSYEDAIQAVFKKNEELKNQLSSLEGNLTFEKNMLQELQDNSHNVEFSDVEVNINGKVENNFKRGFLNIDGRTFFSNDVINAIATEDINYEDNVLYVGHSSTNKVNLMDTCPPYDCSLPSNYSTDLFKMAGETYNGFSMDFAYTQYILINLKNEFSNIEFYFGHVDGGGNQDCTLNVYLDGNLLQSINQKADSDVSHINLPLNYGRHLKFEMVSNPYGKQYGFGDIVLQY
jgi:hypothetical protein